MRIYVENFLIAGSNTVRKKKDEVMKKLINYITNSQQRIKTMKKPIRSYEHFISLLTYVTRSHDLLHTS